MILRFIRACLRRVLNLSFLAALSVLLGIGLGILWERSMRVEDWLTYSRPSGQSVDVSTVPRGLMFGLFTPWGDERTDPIGWSFRSKEWKPPHSPKSLEIMANGSWLGFNVVGNDWSHGTGGYRFVEAKIPLWFPMLLTGIAPLCWLRRWRRQARRVRLGLCLHCGYDLRSTPDPTSPRLPRCPECGRDT